MVISYIPPSPGPGRDFGHGLGAVLVVDASSGGGEQ